jgi:hypothetical protein
MQRLGTCYAETVPASACSYAHFWLTGKSVHASVLRDVMPGNTYKIQYTNIYPPL